MKKLLHHILITLFVFWFGFAHGQQPLLQNEMPQWHFSIYLGYNVYSQSRADIKTTMRENGYDMTTTSWFWNTTTDHPKARNIPEFNLDIDFKMKGNSYFGAIIGMSNWVEIEGRHRIYSSFDIYQSTFKIAPFYRLYLGQDNGHIFAGPSLNVMTFKNEGYNFLGGRETHNRPGLTMGLFTIFPSKRSLYFGLGTQFHYITKSKIGPFMGKTKGYDLPDKEIVFPTIELNNFHFSIGLTMGFRSG